MNAFLSKLAMIGVVAGGFFVTGDLPRLIERGRRITERSTVPLPASGPTASATVAANPAASVPEAFPPAPPPRFEAPQPAIAAAKPVPPKPATPEPVTAAADDAPENDPAQIPMPKLALDRIDLAALAPGQRVLLLCGRHVIALDVVDGPAGEVLEHTHAVHSDRTVTIASTATARRLVAIGTTAGPVAGSARLPARTSGRIARGEWLHLIPSGSVTSSGGAIPPSATWATEQIGPIEAIGLE